MRSTGTEDDSSPLPQLKDLAVTARAGRARYQRDPRQRSCRGATLLKRLVKTPPDLFASRVTLMRDFSGHELITAILDAGGHVIAR